jgi:hypothetical protein
MRYTFRPLPIWPYPETKPRSGSPFSASYSRTLELLESELAALHAKNVIIGAGFTEHDIRNDGLPRADARRPSHPGVELSFDSRVGRLVYATDAFDASWYGKQGWQENLRAIALGLEALRKLERYGISKRGQQYAGWKALPSAGGITIADAGEARTLLRTYAGPGDYGYGKAGLEKMYRAAVKRTHPDTGGTEDAFKHVQAAWHLLKTLGEVA